METSPSFEVSVNFRVERVGAFAWRPTKLTVFSDGSSKESQPFKDDLLDIVLRKLGLLMRADGQGRFEAKKKAHAV